MEVDGALFGHYKYHTSATVWENISCIRITPHIYTTLSDLDKLVRATETIVGQKLSKGG